MRRLPTATLALALVLGGCAGSRPPYLPGLDAGPGGDAGISFTDSGSAPDAARLESGTTCGAATCLGCCLASGLCAPGTSDTECGRNGAPCANCAASKSTCKASTCAGCSPQCKDKPCGASDGCGGACKPGSGCCNGCLEGGTCYPGTSTSRCGSGGAACSSCSTSTPCKGASCSTGSCKITSVADGSGCSGGTCYGGACCTGCWSGSSCKGGTTLSACGSGGAACKTCSSSACQTASCSGGGCKLSSVANGTSCTGGRCYSGSCCTGCWSGSSCGSGSTTSACGDNGDPCQSCASWYKCNGSCYCGPSPHYKLVSGACKPSCGAYLGTKGWSNTGAGCCAKGCLAGTKSSGLWETHDCAYCCENSGASPCL